MSDETTPKKRGPYGPRKKKALTEVEEAANAEQQPEQPPAKPGIFSEEAARIRRERSKKNANVFAPIWEIAIEKGEVTLLNAGAQHLIDKGANPDEVLKRAQRVPRMREVKCVTSNENVLEKLSKACGVITAYYVPIEPSHPLTESMVQIVEALGCWTSAVSKALSEPG